MQTPSVIVIADPALGCIPLDIHVYLSEGGIPCTLVTAEEFKTFPSVVTEAEVVVSGINVKFDAVCLDRLPKLGAIVSAVIGLDAIDLQEASSRSIMVANSPAVEASESLAEATILLILACLYDLPLNQQLLATNSIRPVRPSGRMLKGRTVGLVGFGRAAQEVAVRLATWGIKIVAYARNPPNSFDHVEFTSLAELMGRSDIVSIHVALNDGTRNLLDEVLLKSMKPGSVLVNTARGAIVDESALHQLVSAGHIRSVGLDVFTTEPLPEASPLRALDRAILTPHRLGHTEESFQALCKTAAENVLDFVNRRPLRNAVSVY